LQRRFYKSLSFYDVGEMLRKDWRLWLSRGSLLRSLKGLPKFNRRLKKLT
jgi:hypothetical protein